MGFVGTKPTISSNVIIADTGTIGSASDEDAISIAADGSVTFTQDIELGHASDTTIARSGSGDITIEGNAVYRAGGTDVPVADGGTGQSNLTNLITMGSHTTGNYVATITAGTGLTSNGATSGESIAHSLSVDASQTQITAVGTIATGVWQGTAIASAYLDSDTAHLSGTQTFSGAKTFTSTITVGVDDTGQDVKFFGASAGAYMEWDESADQLRIMGASADAATSTGKLLLATSLTDINANDVLGKVEFQAPHEAGGTDAITVAAAIEAVAQGTFSGSVNATDILFKTGHSEAATEKFRFTSQGEIGIGGANYGTDGQLLTSGGAGAAPAWEDAPAGGVSITATANGAISAGDRVSYRTDGDIETTTGIQDGLTWGGFSPPAGTAVIQHASVYYSAIGFDPDNNKFIVLYRDGSNNNYPTMAMGHIDDAAAHTVAFGTPVVLKSTNTSSYSTTGHIPYDTNVNRFLVPYTANDNNIYAKVCTVNDAAANTITAGAEQTLESGSDIDHAVVFDSNANRMIMVFADENNSNINSAAAFTVRGASDNDIQTLGTTLALTDADDIDGVISGLCFDSNDNKVMHVYIDASNSNRATAVAITVAAGDNSLTKGTAVVLSTTTLNGGYFSSVVHDPVANINLFVARQSSVSMLMVPFTSASGSITAGTQLDHTTITSGYEFGTYIHADYNPDHDKIVIFVAYSGMIIMTGGITGTGSSATFGVEAQIQYVNKNGDANGGYINYVSSAYDTNSNKHAVFYYSNTSTKGLYVMLPTIGKNSSGFIGIANSAISNDATGTVICGGIGTGQSSLSIGSQYYVDAGGNLSTTTGTVFAGRALSATTILVNAPHAAA